MWLVFWVHGWGDSGSQQHTNTASTHSTKLNSSGTEATLWTKDRTWISAEVPVSVTQARRAGLRGLLLWDLPCLSFSNACREREADDRTEKSHGFSVTPLSNSLNLTFQGIWQLQVLRERQISEHCFIFFWITNTETHSVDHDVHTEVTAEVWDYRWEEQTKWFQECKMTGNYLIVVHLRLSIKACGRRSWLSLQVHFHHVKRFRPSGWIVSVFKICTLRWRGDLATRRSSVKEPPTSRLSPFNPFCICLVFPRSHLFLNRGVQGWRGICVFTQTDGT